MTKIENRHTWGIKTAARLRAVHAGFPDLGEEERRGYLVDEIEYALEDASTVPGETRQSLLETLEDYFPVFGETASVAPSLEQQAAQPPQAPAAARDQAIDGMVDDLCARSRELNPAQLRKLADLMSAVAPPNSSNTLPQPLTEKLAFPASAVEVDDFLKSVSQLWLELGVQGDDEPPLRLNRLLKMLGILSGGFRDIYRVLWPYWSEMAPRELKAQVAAAYPHGLEAAIQSFVTGGEVGGGEFHREVEKTKRTLLSILFGLRKGAEDYGKLYERKFSPEAIADTVLLEESATDPGRVREFGRKCWDKYTQLSKHQTADTIHDEIVKTVAEAAFTKLKLTSS
jgi:hypothetical protein